MMQRFGNHTIVRVLSAFGLCAQIAQAQSTVPAKDAGTPTAAGPSMKTALPMKVKSAVVPAPVDPRAMRDPFEPPPRAPERLVQPVFTGTLTATLVGGKQHLATIRLPNKELKVVGVGDTLKGWRISAIDGSSVTAETHVDRQVVHTVLRVEAQAHRMAVDSTSRPLLPPAINRTPTGSATTGVPADIPLLPPPTRPSGAIRPRSPSGGTL